AIAIANKVGPSGTSEIVHLVCGAISNDIFHTWSTNGGPFSPPDNVFGPTAQLNVPTIAASGIGVTITGQGLNSLGQQSIYGSYSSDGMTWGPPFPIYSAQTTNDTLYFSAPNTLYANPDLLMMFASESTSSTPGSGFLVNIWGNPRAATPNFMSAQIGQSQVGQSLFFAPAGCLTNPPALSAAIIARNTSNAVDLLQSTDLTNPALFMLSLLDNNNDFQLAAACNASQAIFAIAFQGSSTNVYTCTPPPPPP